jgi:cell division protease FtsH
MVTEWGMSEKLGPLTFGKKDEQIFLGREIARHKDYSEKTAEDIDDEIRSIISDAYVKTKKILTDNFALLDLFAKKLLEKETMDLEEINEMIRQFQAEGTVQA